MMNGKMRQLVHQTLVADELHNTQLTPSLRELADSDILEIKGCFFFKSSVTSEFNIDAALSQSFDRTALEWDKNEVYVRDYLSEKDRQDEPFLLVQGIVLACALCSKLKEYGQFQVVLSYSSPTLTQDTQFTSCVVHFCRTRLDEPPALAPDIEGFEEAVLVIDSSEYDAGSQEWQLCHGNS